MSLPQVTQQRALTLSRPLSCPNPCSPCLELPCPQCSPGQTQTQPCPAVSAAVQDSCRGPNCYSPPPSADPVPGPRLEVSAWAGPDAITGPGMFLRHALRGLLLLAALSGLPAFSLSRRKDYRMHTAGLLECPWVLAVAFQVPGAVRVLRTQASGSSQVWCRAGTCAHRVPWPSAFLLLRHSR